MPSMPHDTTEPGLPMIYRIRVKGHLQSRWEGWFDPMTIAPLPNGDTLLTGALVDQAALHGVLKRIRDLGLPLVSIEGIDSDAPASDNQGSTT